MQFVQIFPLVINFPDYISQWTMRLCSLFVTTTILITPSLHLSPWSLTLLAMPSSHCRPCFHAPSTILAMPLLHYCAPNCNSVLPFQASSPPSLHPVLHFRQRAYCFHYYLSKSLQNSLKNSLNFFENCNIMRSVSSGFEYNSNDGLQQK